MQRWFEKRREGEELGEGKKKGKRLVEAREWEGVFLIVKRATHFYSLTFVVFHFRCLKVTCFQLLVHGCLLIYSPFHAISRLFRGFTSSSPYADPSIVGTTPILTVSSAPSPT